MPLLTVLFLISALLGCVSQSTTRSDFRPVKQQQGSLLWQMPHGEKLNALITFFESANGETGLSIGKEGPQPLMQLLVDHERITASGPLFGGDWTGLRQLMPRKLAAWVYLIDAYKAAQLLQPGKHTLSTRTYTAKVSKSKSKIRSLTVSSSDNIFFIQL